MTALNPWQALMASQTKPSREEYVTARRVAGVVGRPRKVKPVISVDEWLRTLPPSESYLRARLDANTCVAVQWRNAPSGQA